MGRAIEDGPALFGDRYTEVRYEDLLERPNEEVGRLLGFLGVDTDETLVEHCVSSASFEKLSKGRERGQEDPASFYRKGVAGDWKYLFDERDRAGLQRGGRGALDPARLREERRMVGLGTDQERRKRACPVCCAKAVAGWPASTGRSPFWQLRCGGGSTAALLAA